MILMKKVKPWPDISVRVSAEVIVGQVSEVLDLLVVEDERQLRRIPRKTNVATLPSGNVEIHSSFVIFCRFDFYCIVL
jgi:hypothetical protein